MFDHPENLLLLTLLLPVLGAVVVWAMGTRGRSAVRVTALVFALLTLGSAAYLISQYPAGGSQSFAASSLGEVSESLKVQFTVGLDGLSIWMFGLSALLTITAILVSWEAITDRAAGFYALLLLLEAGMLGVFAARDIILFYIFFEFTLIPLFFLIGIWGSEDRRHAAIKFFIFTFSGSVLTFLGLLTIVLWDQSQSATHELTFSIPQLTANLLQHPLPMDAAHHYLQLWVFLALFAGFAIKVPLFPLHTWLPLAHVQAPTAGSVILAGILLKIGTYGFIRFNLGLLPEASAACVPWILWLSVIGVVYGALVALAQKDMKRLIAYSSVSHLGFCMLGIFSLNKLGMQGGVLQMINHGLSTGGLFAVIGMLYERYHTREIAAFGGLTRRLPRMAFFMVLFTMSSIGLPGLNGFAGEFLILCGSFQRGWQQWKDTLSPQLLVIAVISVSGVVLGAWYMLWLVQRVFYGPLREPAPDASHGHAGHGHADEKHASHATVKSGKHDTHVTHTAGHGDDHGAHGALPALPPGPADLNLREILALAPLVVFMFWIGLAPGYFLRGMTSTIDPIAVQAGKPLDAAAGNLPVGTPPPAAKNAAVPADVAAPESFAVPASAESVSSVFIPTHNRSVVQAATDSR